MHQQWHSGCPYAQVLPHNSLVSKTIAKGLEMIQGLHQSLNTFLADRSPLL